jgi:hypothetical protein
MTLVDTLKDHSVIGISQYGKYLELFLANNYPTTNNEMLRTVRIPLNDIQPWQIMEMCNIIDKKAWMNELIKILKNNGPYDQETELLIKLM